MRLSLHEDRRIQLKQSNTFTPARVKAVSLADTLLIRAQSLQPKRPSIPMPMPMPMPREQTQKIAEARGTQERQTTRTPSRMVVNVNIKSWKGEAPAIHREELKGELHKLRLENAQLRQTILKSSREYKRLVKESQQVAIAVQREEKNQEEVLILTRIL